MKLNVHFDTGSHTRRYSINVGGTVLYVAIAEEYLSKLSEDEARHFIVKAFTRAIEKQLLSVFYGADEHDVPSYGNEFLAPTQFKPAEYNGGLIDYDEFWVNYESSWSWEHAHTGDIAYPSKNKGSSNFLKGLSNLFPALNQEVACPAPKECETVSGYKQKVSSMVQHLNDSPHKWPRERIADWLETLDLDIKAVQGV